MREHAILFALALFSGLTARGDAVSGAGNAAKLPAVPEISTKYLIAHREADPHFVTSVERIGPCTLPARVIEDDRLIVPYQLYPRESLRYNEEGTVKMQLIFDPGWCVRKAIVVESSTYWRLDYVSLQWAMAIRWSPKKRTPLLTSDGEPTITIPIGWGASQGTRR